MAASLAWFSLVGLGARALSRILDRPTTWRVIDGVVAVVMLAVAIKLTLGRSGGRVAICAHGQPAQLGSNISAAAPP